MKREGQVTAKEAYEMLQRGDAVEIIDVRQPDDSDFVIRNSTPFR